MKFAQSQAVLCEGVWRGSGFGLDGIDILDKLTCWRKYGQPQGPQSSAAHTRWKPSECTEGTRQRLPSCVRDRRCESLGRGHHG